MRRRTRTKVWLLASVAWIAPAAALAADEVAGQAPGATLEELVVTAERREVSLQKVPVPVTAVSATTLENTGAVGMQSLTGIAPGLVMSQAMISGTPFIRGVGSLLTSAGGEPSVASYIDGVYIGPSFGTLTGFNNVERLEVLRGPQGTLFGRNATGGLIHTITRTPDQTPDTRISVAYGNYQRVTGSAYISRPITDTLAADLAVYLTKQGDGYGTNVTLGNEIFKRNAAMARSKLAWTPTDDLRVIFSADYSWQSDDASVSRTIFPGSVGLAGTRAQPDPHDATLDVPRRVHLVQGGASLKVEYNLSDAISISSLSAWREYRVKLDFDVDQTPLPATRAYFNNGDKTYQQEFLLQGNHDRVKWTTGVFFYRGLSSLNTDIRSLLAPAANFKSSGHPNVSSLAAFGQVTYSLLDTTRFTVGARYTQDSLTLTSNRVALPAAPGIGLGNTAPPGTYLVSATDLKDNTDKLTWRFAIDHDFTDTVMGYASYSRGFKSGAFNASDPGQPPVRPETLDALEVGIKSDLLGRRLRINASAFHYDYKDLQVQASPVPGLIRFINAASARNYGGEVEIDALPPVPVGDLRLHAAVTYLNTKYKDFTNAVVFFPTPTACTPTPTPTGPPTGGNTTCIADVSGNDLTRSPETTINLGIDYSVPVGTGTLELHADYFRSGSFFWDPENRLKQGAYDVSNASIAYRFENGFKVRAFVNNLTDELYYLTVQSQATGDSAYPAPPRTYGIGFDYRF